MLVADQSVLAELSVSAAIALNAPVSGSQHHLGMLGYRHCLVMLQACSGLSEEQAWMAWVMSAGIGLRERAPEPHPSA